MKSSSKNYNDLLLGAGAYSSVGIRSPRHYKNGLSGLKTSPRSTAAIFSGNGSDKDSISGRSRKGKTRQGFYSKK